MKRLLLCLAAVSLLASTACSGDPPKGIYKGKDKPVPEEKKEKDKD